MREMSVTEQRYKAVGEIAEMSRVLAPGGRWLLADVVPRGTTRYVIRFLGMKRFREREPLDAMLADARLAVLAERRVPGLGGQVPVLAIGADS
jgi:hypothetical protein